MSRNGSEVYLLARLEAPIENDLKRLARSLMGCLISTRCLFLNGRPVSIDMLSRFCRCSCTTCSRRCRRRGWLLTIVCWERRTCCPPAYSCSSERASRASILRWPLKSRNQRFVDERRVEKHFDSRMMRRWEGGGGTCGAGVGGAA